MSTHTANTKERKKNGKIKTIFIVRLIRLEIRLVVVITSELYGGEILV